MTTINQIQTDRITTSQQGSWRWQNAYRISHYQATERGTDGAIIWRSVSRSGKYSEPQLRSYGHSHLPHGGLHHRPVSMVLAARSIGWRGVQGLLDRGYSFDC